MIAEAEMTLFRVGCALIWKIYKETSEDVKVIVVMKHSLNDAHKNIVQIE
jgi:hypothetical protein